MHANHCIVHQGNLKGHTCSCIHIATILSIQQCICLSDTVYACIISRSRMQAYREVSNDYLCIYTVAIASRAI